MSNTYKPYCTLKWGGVFLFIFGTVLVAAMVFYCKLVLMLIPFALMFFTLTYIFFQNCNAAVSWNNEKIIILEASTNKDFLWSELPYVYKEQDYSKRYWIIISNRNLDVIERKKRIYFNLRYLLEKEKVITIPLVDAITGCAELERTINEKYNIPKEPGPQFGYYVNPLSHRE